MRAYFVVTSAKENPINKGWIFSCGPFPSLEEAKNEAVLQASLSRVRVIEVLVGEGTVPIGEAHDGFAKVNYYQYVTRKIGDWVLEERPNDNNLP